MEEHSRLTLHRSIAILDHLWIKIITILKTLQTKTNIFFRCQGNHSPFLLINLKMQLFNNLQEGRYRFWETLNTSHQATLISVDSVLIHCVETLGPGNVRCFLAINELPLPVGKLNDPHDFRVTPPFMTRFSKNNLLVHLWHNHRKPI